MRGLAFVLIGLLVAACSEAVTEPERGVLLEEDLAAIRAAIESYAGDHDGALPESLDALVRPDAQGRHYLPSGTPAIHDPWGRAFLYQPAEDGTYELGSSAAR